MGFQRKVFPPSPRRHMFLYFCDIQFMYRYLLAVLLKEQCVILIPPDQTFFVSNHFYVNLVRVVSVRNQFISEVSDALKAKHRLIDLKPQFVPRSKHFSFRL